MKITVLFLLLILSLPGFSQKIFDKIEKKDAAFVKQYFKKTPPASELVADRKALVGDTFQTFRVSVIEWCAIMNSQECLEEVIANKDKLAGTINVKEELNKCLPHTGRNGNIAMLEYLLKQGADINTKCNSCYGQNAVQLSLTYCKYNMFYKLVEKGVPLTETNSKGRNLLHILFASYNDPDFNNSLNVNNRKSSVDSTKNIAIFLKSKGVDVNLRDNDNSTPLHNVASTNQPELYKWMRSNGATIDFNNPKDVVTLLNNATYFRSGQDNETLDNKMFFLIVSLEKIQLNKKLIETLDNYGSYLLSTSIDNMNPEAFIKLMTFKPDVEIVDYNGYKPIEYAIDAEDFYAIDELLKNGAKVNKEALADAKKLFKKKSDVIKKLEEALE